MILFIISVIIQDQNVINPYILTKRYQRQIDFEKKQFRCVSGDKSIPLSDINNGVCNCCDGSDEFLNYTYCFNTCPMSFAKSEVTYLENLFHKAIQKRSALSSNRTNEFRIFKEEIESKRRLLETTKNDLNQAKEKYNKTKASLKLWVYKMNDKPLPDPVKVEEEKQKYINKIDRHVKYQNRLVDEEEGEEEENDSEPKIDPIELQKLHERRSAKWTEMKHDEYEELLDNALEKFKPTENRQKQQTKKGIFGRMKKMANEKSDSNDDSYPKEYIECVDAKNHMKTIERKYTQLLNDVKNGDKRLKLDFGEDHIWFGLSEKSIEVEIAEEDSIVSFGFMNFAFMRSNRQTDIALSHHHIGEFRPPINRMIHYGPAEITDNWNEYAFSLRLVCYPEFRVFETKAPVISKIISIIGLPEVCNTTFSQEDFNNFLHEIAPYKREVFENSEL